MKCFAGPLVRSAERRMTTYLDATAQGTLCRSDARKASVVIKCYTHSARATAESAMSTRRANMVAELSVATRRFITKNIKDSLDELEGDMVQRFQIVQDELTASLNKALSESAVVTHTALNEAYKSQLKTLEAMIEQLLEKQLGSKLQEKATSWTRKLNCLRPI